MYFDSIERSIIYMHVHVFNIFCFFLSFGRISFFFSHSIPSFWDSKYEFSHWRALLSIFFRTLCVFVSVYGSEKSTFTVHRKQSTTIYDTSKNRINILRWCLCATRHPANTNMKCFALWRLRDEKNENNNKKNEWEKKRTWIDYRNVMGEQSKEDWEQHDEWEKKHSKRK